jgi:DNA-binding ferritin-like protein
MEYPMSYSANKLKRKTESSLNPADSQTAACVTELMNAATSFHKLHLKVQGPGSFSEHKALNELYDALPGHADAIAEGYQGACEKILQYEDFAPRILNNVEDALSYLREMKLMINGLQEIMPHSEIVNDLDNVKSTINSIKYKLLFLK